MTNATEVPLLALLTLLVALAPAHATRIEATEVPCPLGPGQVQVHKLVAQAPHGWDADGATYVKGTPFRAYEVSTCADGLSLYGADMALGVAPSQQPAVRTVMTRALAQSRARGGTPDTWPAAERHALAARTYAALGRPKASARLHLSAAWLERDAVVGGFEGVSGPVEADRVLAAAGTELAKDLDAATRRQVLVNVAVIAHRAGHRARRDAALADARATGPTAAETARLDAMQAAIDREERRLVEVVRAWSAVARDTTGAEQAIASYQAAEALRRLGRRDEARRLYDGVATAEATPADLRPLAAYQRDVIDGKAAWEDEAYATLTRVPSFTY